jgi:intein/homing endonuclease
LIKEFLNAFLAGDGNVKQGKFWKGYQFKESNSYFTSSDKLAGDIGELLMKAGKSASYKLLKTRGKEVKFKNGTYTINHDVWIIHEGNSLHNARDKISREIKDYNKNVYDVELEKYHVLLTRRNGKVVWSGNCRSTIIPIARRKK